MARSKKLTPSALARLSNQQKITKKIRVVNDEYEVIIDKIFDESKIDRILYDYLNIFNTTTEGNTVELDDDFIVGMTPIFHTLVLREFTDLRNSIPKGNNIFEIMPVAQTLYNLGKTDSESKGLMIEILDHFDPKQLSRVYSKLEQSGVVINSSKMINKIMESAIPSEESDSENGEE